MTKPLTIVICAYNGEKYLSEVIEAILAQEGFEDYVNKLIVVDNASTDNTMSIVMKYEELNPNVGYIYEEVPGLSHARKHGALVDSEWVAYLDDDNVLMDGWLIEAMAYISENPKIGAFNGASVAAIRHQATHDELIMLKAIFPNLACTHYCLEDYQMNVESAIKGPFGAGMVLRTKPLNEFLDQGWSSNTGRKGDDLGSGEDGEIVNAILEKGFTHGFNKKMGFFHIIPESRLELSYVQKLMRGLTKGYYVFISVKKYYVYYRLRTFSKSVLVVISYPFKLIYPSDQVQKLKRKFDFDSRIDIIKMTLTDVFVLKKRFDQ